VKAFHGGVGVGTRHRAKHTAQLEHAHALGLAVQVELQHLQQRTQQGRAHHAHLAGNRVQQLDRVGVAGQLVLPALFDKAEVDGFLVAQRGQRTAHGKAAALASAAAGVMGASGGVVGRLL
jgi:hypothetical protein